MLESWKPQKKRAGSGVTDPDPELSLYVPQPQCQSSFQNYVRLYSLVFSPSLCLVENLKPRGEHGRGALETSVHCTGHMYTMPVMAATVPQIKNLVGVYCRCRH